MAGITLTTSMPQVNVSTETNTVDVTFETSNIVLTQATSVSPAQIRSYFGADAPLTFDVSTGVFGLDSANVFAGTTTDDLSEGNTNLYYTDSRSRSAISATAPVQYNNNTGVISIDQGALFSGKTTDDLSEGNVNFYFSNARVNAFIQNNITTSDIDEGTNLYYTDQRARQSISGSGNINYNISTGVISASLTTSDVVEGPSNLYYTNARVTAHIQNNITTTDVSEGDNEYFTVARANSAIDARVDSDYINALTIDASNVLYDNIGTDLSSTTSQGAIGELNDKKLDITALTAPVTFFPTTANADVAGYFKLVTDTADPDYNTTSANVSTGAFSGTNNLISELVSEAGVLEGNTTPINITTVGNVRRTSGNTNDAAEFYFEVYKRDSGGTETLLSTSFATSAVRESTFEEFFASALLPDTLFTETDRVVLKFYGSVVDGSGGRTYEFQFGGATPTRTLFPVPVSVIPRVTSAADLTVNSGGFSGLLSPADDTAQKAFATLDQSLDSLNTDISTTGNVTATAYFGDGSNLSNITAAANISNNTTDDLAEGNTNLYYTDARVESVLSGTSTSINTSGNVTATTYFGDGSNLSNVLGEAQFVELLHTYIDTILDGGLISVDGGSAQTQTFELVYDGGTL